MANNVRPTTRKIPLNAGLSQRGAGKGKRPPRPERRGLAFAGLTMAAIGLIFSWLPFVKNIAFVLAIIGLIIAFLAMFANQRRKKILSLASVIVSLLVIVVVLVTQSINSNVAQQAKNKASSALASKQSSAAKYIKWSHASYDATAVGDATTGAGGTPYEGVVKVYGKPEKSSDSTLDNKTTRTASWSSGSGSSAAKVQLTFIKQSDGTFLLSAKTESGLK